ncbi:MAG: hypothetical protein GX896_01995, partial [Clostridiales bacterium]|nr:hypothetical protein [Clostridiales bacterium]
MMNSNNNSYSNINSKFYQLNPYTTLAYFLCLTGITMFSFNPIFLVEALMGGIIFSAFIKNKKEVLSDLMFYIPLLILVGITNPLFSHKGVTPLFFM